MAMKLTPEEQGMLDGKEGPLVQKCMKVLVTLGEIYGAERMVKVKNVHAPGVSYRVAGDAGLSYTQDASEMGKFKIPMTLNTTGIDCFDLETLDFPKDFVEGQQALNAAYEKMGGIGTYTCTPYVVAGCPGFGEHVAWGESSAIIYVNSVIGARTNREGGPTALAAAVCGCVPEYGYHLDQNRKATHLVEVDYDLKTERDFAVMGYYVGKKVGTKVPCFVGVKERPVCEQYKALGAALASSGGIALYHVAGYTPEAPTKEAVLKEDYEVVHFGPEEYAEVERFFTLKEPADLVVIGCPHCTINEVAAVAAALDGKKVKVDTWICLSHQVYALAERMGYTETITKAGATFVRDTCPILCPTSSKGYKGVATNSGKLAHYIRGLWNMDSELVQLEDCIKAALKED
ncbi:MAG: aconitase X catalytic domain-containing protein [Dysosmobacter sp.]|nr:aconitase X catalytic domain-containing protein [Dysosmobacter sp.]